MLYNFSNVINNHNNSMYIIPCCLSHNDIITITAESTNSAVIVFSIRFKIKDR